MKKVYKQIVGITGASSVLGRFLIKQLKKKFIFKIYKDRIDNYSKFNKWLKHNKDIEIFVHLAAIASLINFKKNKKKSFLINTNSSIQLLKTLQCLELNNLKYFLYASTSHVYKPTFGKIKENSKKIPVNFYGQSKNKVENFIIKNRKNFTFNIGIARIFNFYDTNQKKGFFIPDIIGKLTNKKIKKLKLTKVNTCRDYINLKDLTNIILFMIKKKFDKPLNVGSGIKINLVDLVNKIKKKYKSKILTNFELKKYPGYVADINFLRQIGYKKKISKFKI